MGALLELERVRLAKLKQESSQFSAAARQDGFYRTKMRPHCLPRAVAEENLFAGIRQSSMEHFRKLAIKWHDGQDGKPSNHLCDSQVCCVNFLFPFADKPQALAELLRPVYPSIREMVPIEDGRFVTFEWIGTENYLGERMARSPEKGGQRTRGANFTSADAAVMFTLEDGRRQIALIEWKYTESYSRTSYKVAKSGTDRRLIHSHLYDCADCPLEKNLIPSFGALFFEPFYQFMRQQFLAHKMEQARELGADIVSLLHISPACNRDFCRVTSRDLQHLGGSATGVWKRLVRDGSRFAAVSCEDLFGNFDAGRHPGFADWREWMAERYPWVVR